MKDSQKQCPQADLLEAEHRQIAWGWRKRLSEGRAQGQHWRVKSSEGTAKDGDDSNNCGSSLGGLQIDVAKLEDQEVAAAAWDHQRDEATGLWLPEVSAASQVSQKILATELVRSITQPGHHLDMQGCTKSKS